jgi:indoleamine 2,3-dioxygenase
MSLTLQEPLTDDLMKFEIDPVRGFLPSQDPLKRLPESFTLWDEIAYDLPKILVAGKMREILASMPVLPVKDLEDDERSLRRAMMILSYFGHAYVWGEANPADRLPASIAVPWYEAAKRLGRPPVLSYASYALDNWKRIDAAGSLDVDNIGLLQNFLAGQDEEWFITIHVDIEAKAAPAIHAIPHAQRAITNDSPAGLERALTQIADALERMYRVLCRMTEKCDPYIYYNRVRPYIHGWKDNPVLPNGMVYEGVKAYNNVPQKFRGETGAQSAIIPSLDAALRISHKDDPLKTYLQEMRDYMPPRHRAFMEAVEAGPSIREYVKNHQPEQPELAGAYNECVHWVELFRAKHLEYAATYIYKQHALSDANPTKVGTGGTPFMKYLKKHRDESGEHRLS